MSGDIQQSKQQQELKSNKKTSYHLNQELDISIHGCIGVANSVDSMKQTIRRRLDGTQDGLDEIEISQLQTELDTFFSMQQKEMLVHDDGTEESHYWTRVLVPDFMEQWNSMELSLSRRLSGTPQEDKRWSPRND